MICTMYGFCRSIGLRLRGAETCLANLSFEVADFNRWSWEDENVDVGRALICTLHAMENFDPRSTVD